jgi:hypothetical protein
MAERLSSAEHDDAAAPSLDPLLVDFATYERDLDLLGLGDAQVAAAYPRGRLRRTLAWSLVKVACALPVAAVGVIVHVVPFQIVKRLSNRPANEGIRATIKLLGCTVLFSVVYVALGVVVGRVFGPWVGLAAAVLAPLCGYTALRLAERVKRIGGVLEGYRAVTGRRGGALDPVLADRRRVVDAAHVVAGVR